jgi:hypothetical protein
VSIGKTSDTRGGDDFPLPHLRRTSKKRVFIGD